MPTTIAFVTARGRLLLFVLSALIFAALFAACGDDPEPSTPTPTKVAAVETSAAQTTDLPTDDSLPIAAPIGETEAMVDDGDGEAGGETEAMVDDGAAEAGGETEAMVDDGAAEAGGETKAMVDDGAAAAGGETEAMVDDGDAEAGGETKAMVDDGAAIATSSGPLDGIAVPDRFEANDDASVIARYAADKARFEAVLASGSPVLWKTDAIWCHFCVQMRPVVLQLMDEYEGRIHVLIMDYDDGELSEYRRRLNATNHPSFAVIGADGAVVRSFQGVTAKADLVAAIEEVLAAA